MVRTHVGGGENFNYGTITTIRESQNVVNPHGRLKDVRDSGVTLNIILFFSVV